MERLLALTIYGYTDPIYVIYRVKAAHSHCRTLAFFWVAEVSNWIIDGTPLAAKN